MNLSRLLDSVFQATKSMKDRANELQREIEGTEHQLRSLEMAPTSRTDVEAMLRHWVAQRAAEFSVSFSKRLEIFARDGRQLDDPRAIQNFVTLAGVSEGDVLRAVNCALCAAHGEHMLKTMVASLDAIEWPARPMSIAEKGATRRRLEDQLRSLRAEQDEIVSKAEEAGVSLR